MLPCPVRFCHFSRLSNALLPWRAQFSDSVLGFSGIILILCTVALLLFRVTSREPEEGALAPETSLSLPSAISGFLK